MPENSDRIGGHYRWRADRGAAPKPEATMHVLLAFAGWSLLPADGEFRPVNGVQKIGRVLGLTEQGAESRVDEEAAEPAEV